MVRPRNARVPPGSVSFQSGETGVLSAEWELLVQRFHESGAQGALAVTGGGVSAISELLGRPGGSASILEIQIPYAAAALREYLGRDPDQYCSEDTALAMAAVACPRAARRAPAADQAGNPASAPQPTGRAAAAPVLGLGVTAALASHRPKKGPHRAFVAVHRAAATTSYSVLLDKGARTRPDEDVLVGQLLLLALAEAAGLGDLPPVAQRSGDQFTKTHCTAAPLLLELAASRRGIVWSLPDGRLSAAPVQSPTAVLCGSFNPRHFGHEELRQAAERYLAATTGQPQFACYELSVLNVDKPPLDYLTIDRRRAQFSEIPLALTAAPLFAQKAALLPGVTFIVGVDTALRIVAARYRGDHFDSVHAVLREIRRHGCQFLVAGRMANGRFQTLRDVEVPAEFRDLFRNLPESEFRADISSTLLRQDDPRPG